MPDKSNTRKTIMNTVVQMLRDHSFDTASIDDICAKAALTKGAFYYYFKSKDDVIGQYLLEHIHLIDAERATNLNKILLSDDCYQQLLILFHPLCEMCNHLGTEVLQMATSTLFDQYYTTLLGRNNESGYQLITNLIEKGQRQGMFHNTKPATKLCEIMGDALFGLAFYWSHHDAPFDLEEKTALTIAGILDYKEE